MYKWFADDTELRTSKDHSKPNVFLFGGIIINSLEEKKLRNIIKSIKAKYTDPGLPIKWNFRDLKEVYVRFEREKDYNRLLESSHRWRTEIFKKSLEVDFRIVISVLENFQYQKNNLKKIKGDLNCFLFANSLMRLGIYAKRQKIKEFQIILDWPEKGDPTPFNKEYYYAFNEGVSKDGIEFHCGSLSQLGFQESVLFTKMTHSNSLQFADMIMGAFKGFCETYFHGKDSSLGKELTEIVLNKFNGYPDSIMGIGINVPRQNQDLKFSIQKIFDNYEV